MGHRARACETEIRVKGTVLEVGKHRYVWDIFWSTLRPEQSNALTHLLCASILLQLLLLCSCQRRETRLREMKSPGP